jgi:hypothetical protein
MRFISRSGLVALVGVVAMSSIAVASAMATPKYYIEGKAITASETVSSTGGTSTMTSTVTGVPFELVSKKSKGTGVISPGGASKYGLTFEENTVTAPAGCKLSEARQRSFSIVEMTGALSEEGSENYLVKFSQPGITIELSHCINTWFNGSHTVSGTIGAAMPAGLESVEQTMSFSGISHENLTWFAGSPFTIASTNSVKLAGTNKGKKFGINQ